MSDVCLRFVWAVPSGVVADTSERTKTSTRASRTVLVRAW